MAIEEIKILGGRFGTTCQLNSTANSAHLPRKLAKCAKLAVLFSWQLQNGPQDFDSFNFHRCRLLI